MREISSDDHLEGEEEEKRLDAVEASVDEVSHEQIVGVRAFASNLEQFHQVVELTVDVTADLVEEKNRKG